MTDNRYTLAHPLDEGNTYTKGAKAATAGETIPLNSNAAAVLANAGYLNLDKDGKPVTVAESAKA